MDGLAIDDDAGSLIVFIKEDFFDKGSFEDVDSVFLEFGFHFSNEGVCTAFKDEGALVHEIRKDDAEGDGGVFQGRAIGEGDGFQEETMDVGPVGEKLLKEVEGGTRVIIVEIHAF